MAEILKEWLSERTKQHITWDAEQFGPMMKDGIIISKILLSYNVITEDDFKLLVQTSIPQDIRSNWSFLAKWLSGLEIDLNEEELTDLCNGRSTRYLRLFYQLFLHLDKLDRTDFIKQGKKLTSNLLKKIDHRFQVDAVPLPSPSAVDLSIPLLREKEFIAWQKQKEKEAKQTYEFLKCKYSKKLKYLQKMKEKSLQSAAQPKITKSSLKLDMDRFSKRFPCKYKNYTYEDLLELDEKVTENHKNIVDSKWANDYLTNLHEKLKKNSDSEQFQKELRSELSTQMWEDSIAEEKYKLESELATKVLKLCHFEKQMCTQLMETKQQARNLIQTRINAEKEFIEQREQNFHQFFDRLKEEINSGYEEIDFESQRQKILHKKLYEEKKKRIQKKHYEICYDTLLAMIDYAVKYRNYKVMSQNDIPEIFIRKWKTLFFKMQPIFNILKPVEDILSYVEPNSMSKLDTAKIEIIELEHERQTALNIVDFMEYHSYTGQWVLEQTIPNFSSFAEERKIENFGLRILGHVVFTLLSIKYPHPPMKQPADVPKFEVRAMLRNIPDRSTMVAIHSLLAYKNIQTIKLQSCINYCLNSYKNEMIGSEDIELEFDKFLASASEESSRDLIKLMQFEEESSTENASNQSPNTNPNTKQTQTPKALPEEDISLSTAAELGRYAFQALSLGDSLTPNLIAAMIVEYLKDLGNINGFVIMNYPNSYKDARALEETFSGRVLDSDTLLDENDDVYIEEDISKHDKEEDMYINVRASKLVPDPSKKDNFYDSYKSYFTCYLKLIESENIPDEIVVWDLPKENTQYIDRFYSSFGINYSLYYESIDKNILAQICRYVIGDFTMPCKSDDSLFGPNVLDDLDLTPEVPGRVPKAKLVKQEDRLTSARSKENRSYMSNVSKTSGISTKTDESTPFDSEGKLEEESVKTVLSDESVKSESLPGDENWEFTVLPIFEPFGISLATCWEEIERTYIHDMELMFLSKRTILNNLVPYIRFIKDKINQVISIQSNKQDHVEKFQMQYNEFDNDWRDYSVAKNEWHCRAKELKMKLYDICDTRKISAQKQCEAIIVDNWSLDELTSLVNIYISCMQVELNRYIMTIQLVHDYYYSMMQKFPPVERILSKDLTRISRDIDEVSKKSDDKIFAQLKTAFTEILSKNITIDYTNNPFNFIMDLNVKNAQKIIKDVNDLYKHIILKEKSEWGSGGITRKIDESSETTEKDPQEIFQEKVVRALNEWLMCINGEMNRANLRIIVLQQRCFRIMKLFSDSVVKALREIQFDINTHYENEILAVDHLCKFIQMAIEQEKHITEKLILENDKFIIDPNNIQIETPIPQYEPEKPKDNTIFSFNQLAILRDQFKLCAPSCCLLHKSFLYILQDFVVYGQEACGAISFPESWKKIDPEQVPQLVHATFGLNGYIDWRDFLIYCTKIPFPEENELLKLRHDLRCCDPEGTELISRENFLELKLWYESKMFLCSNPLHKNLMKHFLFELFETAPDVMNFSPFLLAMCKNENPIEGFVNALTIAVGCKIIYQGEDCEQIIDKLIEEKEYKQACHECAMKCADEFMTKLLDNVVNTSENTIITELEFEEIKPAKGKKGKSEPVKPQGGRDTKKGKNEAKNKNSQSSMTKMTYICPPCYVEEQPEQSKVEEQSLEEVAEESFLTRDENVLYAIPEEVIRNVLNICLPWYMDDRIDSSYLQNLNSVLEKLKEETENGDIYVNHFISQPFVCKLIHKSGRFTDINIDEKVANVCKQSHNKPYVPM